MAYKFRLESVLTYRRNLEELAQQQLARELLLLDEFRAGLVRLEEDLARFVAELEERKKKPMAAPLFTLYTQAIERKENDIIQQHRKITAQATAVEKARERDQEKYIREVLQKEQNASDEQMVLRFNRHGSRLAR